MEIADRRVATIHFTVFDEQGAEFATTHGHDPLVHMYGSGGIVPALEEALAGKQAGDTFEVTVPPEKGFGAHHPELVQSVPRSAFKGQSEPVPGGTLQAQTARGPLEVRVTDVDADAIGVDGNHPLAGKTFRMAVEVVDVRLATPDEIQFGLR